IEVPLQFKVYRSVLDYISQNIQPEMIFIPEATIGMASSNFHAHMKRNKKRIRRRGGEFSESEQKKRIFMGFVFSNFTGKSKKPLSVNISGPPGAFRFYELRSPMPNYWTFLINFLNGEYPWFDYVLNKYVFNLAGRERPFFWWRREEEDLETLELITGKSLKQISLEEESYEDFRKAVDFKGMGLIYSLESMAGKSNFKKFIGDFLTTHKFRSADYSEFIKGLSENFKQDYSDFFRFWMESKSIPAFKITEEEAYEISTDLQPKYQLRIRIKNLGEIGGRIKIGLLSGRFRRVNPGEYEFEKAFEIGAGEERDLFIVTDKRYTFYILDPIFSKNVPRFIRRRISYADKPLNKEPVEGSLLVEEKREQKELIVDNLDEGFKLKKAEGRKGSIFSFLRPALRGEKKRIVTWSPWRRVPDRWIRFINPGMYGDYYLSAAAKAPGDGSQSAIWTVEIPKGGYYETFIFIPPVLKDRKRKRPGEYKVIVHHDDGDEQINVDLKGSSLGWISLGSYYFSKGQASIELTDESDGIIIADAVRWVKIER
ncbi:MAG: M1 family aminopeptidase, partial [Fidelibacterota bacterium]